MRQSMFVKEEPGCVGVSDDCVEGEAEYGLEPSSVSAGVCGVSAAAARAGLYAGHAVKDELVLGPECLQPRDVAFKLPVCTEEESEYPKENLYQKVEAECKNDKADSSKESSCFINNNNVTCNAMVLQTEKHQSAVVVKEEPGWSLPAGSCGVSEAAARAGLYTDHEVKDELVVGPECLHLPNISNSLCGKVSAVSSDVSGAFRRKHPVLKECEVRLQRLQYQEAPDLSHWAAGSNTGKIRNGKGYRHVVKSEERPSSSIAYTKGRRRHRKARHACCGHSSPGRVKGQHRKHGVVESVKCPSKIPYKESPFALTECQVRLERFDINKLTIYRGTDRDTTSNTQTQDLENKIKNKKDIKAQESSTCKWSLPRECSVRLERCLAAELRARHEAVHTGENFGQEITADSVPKLTSYECDSCGRTFKLKLTLIRHIQSHKSNKRRGKKMYSCEKCKQKFSNAASFKRHILIHTSEKLYLCDICGKKCSSSAHLKEHERVHTGEKPFSCGTCGKRFTLKGNLTQHELIHAGEKFPCGVCGKQLSHLSTLYMHRICHAGIKPYSCDICHKKFQQPNHLKAHKGTHTGEKPYSCDVCNKKFRQLNNLNRHKKIHTGEKDYSCEVCLKVFAELDTLKRHQLTHTGEKPHSCKICNKKFADRGSVNTHQLVHSEDRPHSCIICKKRFKLRGNLKKHENIHTGEKPYSCKTCGKAFRLLASLQLHERTHKGVKTFACQICGRAFLAKANLTTHEKIHTGIKPHSCDICNRRFLSKHDLKRHKKIHTGEKPFKCDICGKRFYEEKYLRAHEKNHTGQKRFSCDLCPKGFSQKHRLAEHILTHENNGGIK